MRVDGNTSIVRPTRSGLREPAWKPQARVVLHTVSVAEVSTSSDFFLFSVHLGSRWCRARNPITTKARVQRNMAPVWSLELAAAPPALIWTPTPASQALHRTLSQSTQGRFPANGRERERQTDRLRDVPVCVSDVVFGTNASRTLNFGNGPTAWGCLLLRL